MQIPEKPMDELVMAIAGPATSFLLGCVLLPLGPVLAATTGVTETSFGGQVVALVLFLGVANFGYVVFNMLPAFPMDGGRVLRSLLVKKYGRLRATFVASLIGKVLAVLIAFAGLTSIGNLGHFILIGVIIFMGARCAEESQDAIPHQAGDGTAVALYRLYEALKNLVDYGCPLFGIEGSCQGCRPGHIAE